MDYILATVEAAKMNGSTLTAKEFTNFIIAYHILQPYFIGVLLALMLLRFFFSLKITRIFGSFIKMISLSLLNLLVWTLFTIILILAMSSYLSILLQENQGCSSVWSCS